MLTSRLLQILSLGAIIPLRPTLASDRFLDLIQNSTTHLTLPYFADPGPLAPIGPNLYVHWSRVNVPAEYRPPHAQYPRADVLATLDFLRSNLLERLEEQGDVVLPLDSAEAIHGRVFVNITPDREHFTISMALCTIDGIADQFQRQPDWWRGLVYLGQGQEPDLVALALLIPRGR